MHVSRVTLILHRCFLTAVLLLMLLSVNPSQAASVSADPGPGSSTGKVVDRISLNTPTDALASDLELQEINVPDGTYVQGTRISIYTDIENIGSETSNVSSVDYYASTDTNINDTDTFLGKDDLPAFEAGNSFKFYSDQTIPANLASGSYYIGAILNVVDADDTNHVNHDPTAITLNNDPEIRVRPLSLEFVEEASSRPDNQIASKAATVSAREHTNSIFPSLLQTAGKRGFVRVIVGLESAYQSGSIQNRNDQKIQRRRILDSGRQLIASLKNHTVNIRHQYQTIPFMAMNVDDQALEALRNSPLVRSIEEDTLNRAFMASSNPVIGSSLAWVEGFDGSGWAVAVLDTGVEPSHSWFTTTGDKIVSEACYSSNKADVSESLCPGGVESSTAENSGLYCDLGIRGCDHGTHVAGTVAGNDGFGPNYGVAPGADVIAIQVFSKFLTDDDCGTNRAPCLLSLDSDQVAAMERVLQLSDSMNIASVNMSLGGDVYPDQPSCDADNLSKKAAIQNLLDAGIATVIAAGNDRSGNSIAAPACISNAISVGATDDVDNVAGFSNIYPQLDLLAPGVDINSSIPPDRLASKSGTSMAAPHVAGAWAVMKQRFPLASVKDVLDAFTNTATRVTDQRPQAADPVQTFARINLDMAIGEPRTSFVIFNEGLRTLNVDSIVPSPAAPWVSLVPEPPFAIEAGELKVVSVVVDYNSAPAGDSQLRLLVNSDDPDQDPYPEGVFVNLRRLSGPEPEFDSTPQPFSVINLGPVYLGHTSTEKTVRFENKGTANLTIACSKTGTESADFMMGTCATPIAPANSTEIPLFCTPSVAGAKTATLNVTTNDANETNLSYRLYCMGVELPTADEIFKNDFEG